MIVPKKIILKISAVPVETQVICHSDDESIVCTETSFRFLILLKGHTTIFKMPRMTWHNMTWSTGIGYMGIFFCFA